MKTLPLLLFLISFTAADSRGITPPGHPGFEGEWVMAPHKSTDIDLYGALSLRIRPESDGITLIQKWGRSRAFTDSLTLPTDGSVVGVAVTNRVFPSNVFMGLKMKEGSPRRISAVWEDEGRTLKVTERFVVLGSQGEQPVTSIGTYTLDPVRKLITYRIDRSTRPDGQPLTYLLKQAGTREAYVMHMEDDWRIGGKLPEQAMLISLQGIANGDAPRLYFVYPPAWDFRFTPSVLEYYKNDRYYTFTELKTAEQALRTFRDALKGYVVWDKDVRTSLIVAFTVAGLEKAVVVSEDLIPLVEKVGLKKVEDFRGRFTGLNDAQIYQWAYDRYWNRTNKEYIVWMGGEHGEIMKPGVADYGIKQGMFFNDLSTLPTDTEEYALAARLFAEMAPNSLVMGWHSYKKDKERDHVTLASSYGHRVEGLHTLPNMSFSTQIAPTPGFVFKNNHNLEPGKTYTPGKKVYLAAIQTDCLGLGAWERPGRGAIPYAWEVTMNWVWLAPAMMEYFYTQATPNDYFIGSLSGPGYMYPKAIPDDLRPPLIREAARLMKQLDLNVFEIMDYSEGATVEGNSELTKEVIDDYYENMPDAIGFVNGYAPSYSFTNRNGRPLISYDYYLSETRPEADAVADLEELARINPARPYFLLMHVRQWSDITRVKSILDKLGPEFEIVPLDVFLKMAGNQPTFRENLLPPRS